MIERIKIIAPEVCPFCGAKVIKMIDDGAHLYCSNPNCKEKAIQKINYFVAKQCMDIENLSIKTLRLLYDKEKIHNWIDLYKLALEDLYAAGLGPVISSKIIDSISYSRTHTPLNRILMAIGVPMLGKVTSERLVNKFKTVNELINAKFEDIASIPGIGNCAAAEIYNYIKNNKEELSYGIGEVLSPLQEEKQNSNLSNKLEGLTIMATGTLENFSRDSIKKSIIDNGAHYASGISKKLDYLIVGRAAGKSKLDKAEKLGIKLITEEEYLNLIK